MAKKQNDESTSAALATTTTDELAAVFGDDEALGLATDGLEEVDPSDIKIAAKVFNMKGVDHNKDPIPPNVFFDTVDETTTKEVQAVLLTLHKTHEYREFVAAEDRSVVRCRSTDRVTGTMEDGTQRPCRGCPDAQWRTSENGQRSRNCGEVHNIVGVDQVTKKPFVLRCKKTSLPPWKQFLNRHFLGCRVSGGKRSNYPLFAFDVSIRLKMSEDGKYAVPVFERGPVRAKGAILESAEEAKFYREVMLPALEKASELDNDAAAAGSKREPTFTPDDFSDAPPATATASGGLF